MATNILLDGLCFGEGPRWRDGALYFSDMHAHKVLKVTPKGDVTEIVEVPNLPSGLGWLPGGDMLIVSMTDRQLLRFDGQSLHVHADLSALAGFDCNDMVVDATGRAYVGNFGFDLHGGADFTPANLICVEPDGTARVVADEMNFPNGVVITPDGRTLIVGESFAGHLTAFDIEDNGDLGNRRVWADLPGDAIPDGICLDEAGGVWAASPPTNECLRVIEGGEVTHRIALDQRGIACMLGGDDGKTLFILSSADTHPDACTQNPQARVQTAAAPFAGAGFP